MSEYYLFLGSIISFCFGLLYGSVPALYGKVVVKRKTGEHIQTTTFVIVPKYKRVFQNTLDKDGDCYVAIELNDV